MAQSQKTMQMGLGEALNRLNQLRAKISSGIASSTERAEHKLIVQALNQTKLDLGFDCDGDGIPDTIEIFMQTAKTSCCRILDTPSPRRKNRKKSASRG